MKRDEAVDVLEMIMARWPGNRWSAATMEAYINAIEPLDAALSVQAVRRMENELDHAPPIATVREFVRIEKALSERDGPIERQLNDTLSQIMPAWVKGWCVSRSRYRDLRVWPQQDSDEIEGDPMPAEDQERYMLEGASLSIGDMFNSIGRDL